MLNGAHVLKNWFLLTYQPSHTLRSKNYSYTRLNYFKNTAQTVYYRDTLILWCAVPARKIAPFIITSRKAFKLATGKIQKSTIYAKYVLHFCYLSIDIKWLKQTIILPCIKWFTLQHNCYWPNICENKQTWKKQKYNWFILLLWNGILMFLWVSFGWVTKLTVLQNAINSYYGKNG